MNDIVSDCNKRLTEFTSPIVTVRFYALANLHHYFYLRRIVDAELTYFFECFSLAKSNRNVTRDADIPVAVN